MPKNQNNEHWLEIILIRKVPNGCIGKTIKAIPNIKKNVTRKNFL
jgi:hypothetical protein